jgi:hypothetical protein
LTGNRAVRTLNLAREHLIGELLEAVAEPGKLGSRAAPATTLAPARAVAASLFGVVRVVRIA